MTASAGPSGWTGPSAPLSGGTQACGCCMVTITATHMHEVTSTTCTIHADYYNYTVSDQGRSVHYGTDEEDYSTGKAGAARRGQQIGVCAWDSCCGSHPVRALS